MAQSSLIKVFVAVLCSFTMLFASDVTLEQAEGYLKHKNYAEAVATFTELINVNPKNATLYYARGYAYYYADSNITQAEKDFLTAINIEPDYNDAISGLAYAYMVQGKQDQAIKYLNQVRNNNNNDKNVFYTIGLAMYQKAEFVNAVTFFTKAIELDANFTDALYGRAVSYYQLDDFRSMLSDLNKIDVTNISDEYRDEVSRIIKIVDAKK